jgi:GT2 family glycosyltransferase
MIPVSCVSAEQTAGAVERLDTSVVIPTVGRSALLRDCLDSVAACRPPAAEIVVADQSGGTEVGELVTDLAAAGARLVECGGRGIARALNCGLRSARYDVVAVTHDDCVVDPGWVGAATRLLAGSRDLVVTGRVLSGGEAGSVPSTKEDPAPHDFTGERTCGALYPNNMALHRSAALEFGGFDERLLYAAEDNDFSYRWLNAGRRLRYEPELVVQHRDWRPPEELSRLYRGYWRWQGIFYAKHLRARDPWILRFIAQDLLAALRYAGGRVVRGRPRWPDPRAGVLRGLPSGLAEGMRMNW